MALLFDQSPAAGVQSDFKEELGSSEEFASPIQIGWTKCCLLVRRSGKQGWVPRYIWFGYAGGSPAFEHTIRWDPQSSLVG